MARPKIGIFGALMAVGGLLAWRWVQRQRASQPPLARDINRWEGEGGAVVSASQTPGTQTALKPASASSGLPNGAANGSAHPGGSGDAWPFPHS
jgi:hypothetical protein